MIDEITQFVTDMQLIEVEILLALDKMRRMTYLPHGN